MPSRKKEHFGKGAERSCANRNQNRDKVAVCCDVTKHSQCQPVLVGLGEGVNWIEFPAGEEFGSPGYIKPFSSAAFPNVLPIIATPRKRSLGARV